MTIKIFSNNQYLLDILHKNPDTDFGLYAKPLKNGIVIGNAIDAYNYEVIFQDSKYSYLPEDSNAIDFQSYCNPLVVLNIITDFFANQLKQKEQYNQAKIKWLDKLYSEIDTQEVTITIPLFYIDSSWYSNGQYLLAKYFSGIQLCHKQGKLFELVITAKNIFEGINLLAVTALFAHTTNNYGVYTFIDDGFAEKYVRLLTNIDNVPYFVFYLFTKRTIRAERQFEIIRPVFEAYLKSQGLEAKLTYNATHKERIAYITKQLDVNTDIIDIGCGVLLYFKRMNRMGFDKNYFAIDKDINVFNNADTIANQNNNGNLLTFTSLNECETKELVNIIITEVIEHNTPEDAKALVKKAMTYNYKKIIITTPNVSFNKFYAETLEKRHDDHKFEWTEKEFQQFITECIEEPELTTCKFEQIGDSINGIQPTQTVIITKK